ncbi:MAG TPA: ABC transporter ATP-binding protein [Melioribacteraceae bacterium]|nr:ABC transporter ATP-binding protein [Melioribacteraceae bacterium]
METYFRILRYVKPYKKHLALSMLCTILYALLNGASVYLTIPLLDTLFKTENTEIIEQNKQIELNTKPTIVEEVMNFVSTKAKEFIFAGTTKDVLLKISIIVILAFFGKNLFGFLQSYYLAYVEQGVVKDIRNEAYEKLHNLPMSFFKNEKTGNLISRITNDVNLIQNSVSTVFLNLLREPLSIIVFLGIAISISWKLTAFSLIVLPFSLFIIGYIGLHLRKHSAIIQDKMADITTILHETISGVKIVKAFGKEDHESKKFKKETNNYFKLVIKLTRIRNAASPLTEFLSVIVGGVIIYYGGLLVLEDKLINASEFLGFLFAIFQLMPPIKELSGVNNRIQESSAAGDRIFEIMDVPPQIKDAIDAKEIASFNSEIKFNNLSFKYEDAEELILQNINFSVNKGEVIALVGSSGGGKTTLVDLIPRFYDPTDGAILFDGIDIRNIKISSLRKLLGIVTQETVLFNDTIKNNISYGVNYCSEDELIAAAKAANAHDFILELPKGYDTIIGERGTKISGGQRQRLSIARALLKNPPIMILDEATSALDNESEALVQGAIEQLMKDRTTFVIAHRLSTIKHADKIIVIDEGKIVQMGVHDTLIKEDGGIYKKLYELQFKK